MRARVHSASGALLAGYTALHLWELSAASSGREAFVERLAWRTGAAAGSAAFVVAIAALLLSHVVLGVLRSRGDAGERGPYGSRDDRRLQWLTAVIAALFVLAHVGHVWSAAGVGGVDARAAYDRLRAELGRPGWLSLYVLGTGALFLHLAGG